MGTTKTFQTTREVDAPPSRVWEVLAEVERWSEWTASVSSIRRNDKGALAAGSRLVIRQPKLPPALWRITEVHEGRGFTSITGTPLVRVTANHVLEPKGTGTVVTLSIRFSGPLAGLVARITRGLNERYLALEADGLKKRVEESNRG